VYTIGNIIYGVPWTAALEALWNNVEHGNSEGLGKLEEVESFGFEKLYSGSADYMPGYLGVELNEFDCCETWTTISEILPEPTTAQMKEAKRKVDALPKKIRDLVPKIGIYIIWSTS